MEHLEVLSRSRLEQEALAELEQAALLATADWAAVEEIHHLAQRLLAETSITRLETGLQEDYHSTHARMSQH